MNKAFETSLPAAALAAGPAPEMSDRYVYIDTREIARLMQSEGWELAATRGVRRRDGSPAVHSRHRLDFQRPDAKLEFGGLLPRIIFTNSHDGSCRAEARLGFMRVVCTNGLMVWNRATLSRTRHVGQDALSFVHEMQRMEVNFGVEVETVERWHRKQLTAAQRTEYALLVNQLRWGDAWAVEPEVLLAPRRMEDDDGTLWTAFNRAQENTTRGGQPARARSGRRILTQPLTSIAADTKFNETLWRMTDELSQHW